MALGQFDNILQGQSQRAKRGEKLPGKTYAPSHAIAECLEPPLPGRECPALCPLCVLGPGPALSLFGRRDGLLPRRLKQLESLGEMIHPHSAPHLAGRGHFARKVTL